MDVSRSVILALPVTDDRPWSSARTLPKSLVPVATRPILFHTLDALRAAGVRQSVLLAPPADVAAFAAAVDCGARWDMEVDCRPGAAGQELRGALRSAGAFESGGPVIVQHADALLTERLGDHLAGFHAERLDALGLMLAPARSAAPEARRAAGWILSARGVELLRRGTGTRNALARLRRQGGQVRLVDVEGCLACAGDEEALLAANRHALLQIRPTVSDATLEECELQGSVAIHPTASLRGTLVRGPVSIGAGAHITDSYIGPYTSIGAGTTIQGTEIEHSIVMDGAELMFVGSRLETSVIGRDARVVRRFAMPSTVRVSIGDGAEVALA